MLFIIVSPVFSSQQLSFSCALNPSKNQFGVFSYANDGQYAFATGVTNLSDTSFTYLTGTGFGKFSEYVDGKHFVFPSDKYPGMFSGSRHIHRRFTRGSYDGPVYDNDEHFLQGSKVAWSENCQLNELSKIKEIYTNVYKRFHLTPMVGLPGGFQGRFNETHLYVKSDEQSYLFMLEGPFSEIVANDPKKNDWASEFSRPVLQDEIFNVYYTTYSGSFRSSKFFEQYTVFMRIFKLWSDRKMVKFYVVGADIDPHTGEGILTGTISTQKFLNGCCNYNVFWLKNNFEVSWENIKFENHWYWITASFTYSPPKFLLGDVEFEMTATKVTDLNDNVKQLQKVYDEKIVGKTCEWLETETRGQLVAGFQWLSLKQAKKGGREIKQIYLSVISRGNNQIEYVVNGCGPLA
jgi:hypothetical protein